MINCLIRTFTFENYVYTGIQHVQFNIHNKAHIAKCSQLLFSSENLNLCLNIYCNLHDLYLGVHVSGLFIIFFCIASVFVPLLFMVSEHFDGKFFEQFSNRFIWYFRLISLTLWRSISCVYKSKLIENRIGWMTYKILNRNLTIT